MMTGSESCVGRNVRVKFMCSCVLQ